ncbi:MAG: permease [Candidatus Gracilibacteria bacterium]|nr:permease [Candidatus Gracilibacteria bacterium]
MQMTHYMELLASNQPWNLILFMAIPVILAETVAITELVILFTGKRTGNIATLSKFAGITGGIYFIGVFFYLLFTAVIPLTTTGTWRGIADVVAVGFYLLGIIPLVGIALVDMGIIGGPTGERKSLKLHATFVGIFLVFAHIAMIFGMLDPSILGWQQPMQNSPMNMNDTMPGMDHRNM